MKTNHSPLPWKFRDGGDIFEANSDRSILRSTMYLSWAKATENAAFIVRCCNSHDALVSALAELLDREWQDDEGMPTLEAARSKARAALALAKGV